MVALRRVAGWLEVAAVVEAIAQGWTWAQEGEALGISAQAAHKKPSRLQGAHVVAAICDLEHGTTARALAALAVARDRLRAAARAGVGIG